MKNTKVIQKLENHTNTRKSFTYLKIIQILANHSNHSKTFIYSKVIKLHFGNVPKCKAAMYQKVLRQLTKWGLMDSLQNSLEKVESTKVPTGYTILLWFIFETEIFSIFGLFSSFFNSLGFLNYYWVFNLFSSLLNISEIFNFFEIF